MQIRLSAELLSRSVEAGLLMSKLEGKLEVEKGIREKSLDLKNFFAGINAVLEQWKFSVEETKEGTRIEIHAVALVRHPKSGKH